MLPYLREHKARARELRKNMTEAERLLWAELRRKQILGVQFYRQKPIGPYVADFYCPKARLVIELDGSQHQAPDHQQQDRIRDRDLEAFDLTILRFDNHEVFRDLTAVLAQIEQSVSRALNQPPGPRNKDPRPRGGRGDFRSPL